MSKHEVPCKTPGTFMRRVGSLWMCWCGELYRLGYEPGYGGDCWKAWQKVER